MRLKKSCCIAQGKVWLDGMYLYENTENFLRSVSQHCQPCAYATTIDAISVSPFSWSQLHKSPPKIANPVGHLISVAWSNPSKYFFIRYKRRLRLQFRVHIGCTRSLSQRQTIDKVGQLLGRGLVSEDHRLMKSLNVSLVTSRLWRQKMADDKDADAFILLYFLTAKQHKKRTIWVRRWLLDR